MRPRQQLIILLIILAVGAILRGLYLAEVVHHPDFERPGLDAGYHDYWARALVSGNWKPPYQNPDPMIRTTSFFRPPGYPYFLALLYRITGSSYLWSRMLQMLLGLASCVFAFLLGRRIFGPTIGLVFAASMSFYWAFIYYEGEFLEPALTVVLVLAMLYTLCLWTERVTWWRAISAGVLLGLYALARPNVLLFVPVVLVWAYWISGRGRQRHALVTAALGFVVGVVIAVSPATIRNYVVAREFVPVSSNAGVNLYLGNNPSADGYNPASPLIPRWTCYDYPAIVQKLERSLGRKLTYSQASSYYAGQATRYIRQNPGPTLRLTWEKALLFWGPKEVSNEKQDEIERTHSRVLGSVPGGFSSALACGILGLAVLTYDLGRRREDAASVTMVSREVHVSVLVVLFVLTYFASYLPFFVAGRYRLPIVPFILLFGAYALTSFGRALVQREWARSGLILAAWLVLYGLTSRNFAGYRPDLARWHFDRAVSYDLRNRFGEAKHEYTEAIRVKPDYADAYYTLGVLLLKQGRLDDAMKRFLETVRVRPNYADAHYNLGVAYAAQGELDKAVSELREAARYAPDDLATHHALGNLLGQMGRLSEAADQFRVIARLSPDDFVGHYNLGTALAGLGRSDEAISQFRRAVQLRPDYARAHKSLAATLYDTGHYSEAWTHVRLCEKYGGQVHPDFIRMLSRKMPRPSP